MAVVKFSLSVTIYKISVVKMCDLGLKNELTSNVNMSVESTYGRPTSN